jgi:hypothetical protein
MAKTKWALNFKLDMDQAILAALTAKKESIEKRKTKGRFQI